MAGRAYSGRMGGPPREAPIVRASPAGRGGASNAAFRREQRKKIAEETVRILELGHYEAEDGTPVSITEAVQRAVSLTRLYFPPTNLPPPASHSSGSGPSSSATTSSASAPPNSTGKTHIRVMNTTTMAAAHLLMTEGHRSPFVLNFASAKHPGGGFLSGAEAQEESLARATGLYACIKDSEFYDFHRDLKDPFYTHRMIYSPDVPVICDDANGKLIAQPWCCSFLTAAAVNAGVVAKQTPDRVAQVDRLMEERMHYVLQIALAYGHTGLVLGAFGCGVFQNDPRKVAQSFHRLLDSPRFQNKFASIIFAVLDSPGGKNISPFEKVFGSSQP